MNTHDAHEPDRNAREPREPHTSSRWSHELQSNDRRARGKHSRTHRVLRELSEHSPQVSFSSRKISFADADDYEDDYVDNAPVPQAGGNSRNQPRHQNGSCPHSRPAQPTAGSSRATAPPTSGSRAHDWPPPPPEPSQRDKHRAGRIVAEEEEREQTSDTRYSRPSKQNTKGFSAKQKGKLRAQLPSVPEEDEGTEDKLETSRQVSKVIPSAVPQPSTSKGKGRPPPPPPPPVSEDSDEELELFPKRGKTTKAQVIESSPEPSLALVRSATKSKASQANKTQTQRESIDNTAATKKPRKQPAQKSQVRPKMRPIPEPEVEASTPTTNKTTPPPISAPTPMPAPSSSSAATASKSAQAGSSKAATKRKKTVVQPSSRALRSRK